MENAEAARAGIKDFDGGTGFGTPHIDHVALKNPGVTGAYALGAFAVNSDGLQPSSVRLRAVASPAECRRNYLINRSPH